MKIIPRKYFLTRGIGRGDNYIEAFEMALRDAGIEGYNLVPVSSILPKNCERVDIDSGKKELEYGQIVFCVMARKVFREGTHSVAVGVAKGNADHGYFVEIERDDDKAEEEALSTAKRLFRSKFGEEPSEVEVVSAETTGDGKKYTCIVAVAVLIT